MIYDSTEDTKAHIAEVRRFLRDASDELLKRALLHDRSKLESPEKEIFDIMTPKLKELTYGSPEYKESLKELGVALTHHYENNTHHPEHYPNGVGGMSLFDLIEMFFDWWAAGKRNKNGNIRTSIETNSIRFGLDDQISDIFHNTVNEYEAKYETATNIGEERSDR